MRTALIITGEFYFGSENLSLAPDKIKCNFRFSLWNGAKLYTPGELKEIIGVKEIFPEQSAIVKIMILPGLLAEQLKPGDLLSWGVPYNALGTVKILDEPI